jgi:tryptophanyl-tRNA synthetase
MSVKAKQRIFSGVQPSGNLHIGNYLGALTQFVALQDEYDCIFCVVDLHAITVPQEPAALKKNVIEIAKLFMASGIDPQRAVIFQQSAVSAHAELGWLLNTIARVSDLDKMTQFKDKAGENQESVSVGLYDYPVLMAADILLYDTAVVPVGDDQVQHIELTRDLGKRFNHRFGDTFIIPNAKVLRAGARIMGLDDPTKKMSKSAPSEMSRIELTDDPDKAAKKIMRAETDSGSEISYDEEKKPGISNLLAIYSLLANKEIKEVADGYEGKGYGDFKKDLAGVVKDFLVDFQKKYNAISDEEVRRVLDEGADKVRPIAEAKLRQVQERMGIV